MLSANVASGLLVRRPRANNARSRRLSAPEQERLFAALATCLNPLVVPAVKLLLASAMRCGELLQVGWNDIDYQNSVIYLHQTKNGHARTVPLTLAAEAILKSLPRAIDGTKRVLDGLTYEGLKQAFVRGRKRAQLTDFRLHDLRHEASSRAAESGALSLAELQLVTGHRDVRMVMRYTHMMPGAVAGKLRHAGL